MRFLKIIRSAEWWNYKIPPLLAIGYATLLLNNKSIFEFAGIISIIIISVIVGAIYVSVINDITDAEEDLAVGKKNRMATLPDSVKILLPVLLICIGVLFILFFYKGDPLSVFLYVLPWVLFSLYSFEPFRFKRRGLLGVLCDAGGAHVFVSLLMVSFLTYKGGSTLNYFWLCSVLLWALSYGLKGIFWHQFHDRDNDIKTGVKTFATRTTPQLFKKIEVLILSAELIALAAMLWCISSIWPVIGLFFYIVLTLFRYKVLRRHPVIILTGGRENIQIITLDYFHAIFPITLLIAACFVQPNAWVVLIVHLCLFHREMYRIIKDVVLSIRYI